MGIGMLFTFRLKFPPGEVSYFWLFRVSMSTVPMSYFLTGLPWPEEEMFLKSYQVKACSWLTSFGNVNNFHALVSLSAETMIKIRHRHRHA